MKFGICRDSLIECRLVDPLLLEHYAEHCIAAILCDRRSFVWIVPVWRANHSRDQCGIGHGEILRRLIEVDPGRFAESANFAAVAMTKIDFIQICLEDFVFRETSLDHESDAGFGELAANRAL